MSHGPSRPLLDEFYDQFLSDEDTAVFIKQVSAKYMPATLERLAQRGSRMTRRGAVLALGCIADYDSNPVLGRALLDRDRGVRMLAENGIRSLWCRTGSPAQRRLLEAIIRLNSIQQFEQAGLKATRLIEHAPWFAEAYNQRAIALYCTKRFADSIHDCQQALEINPYHFGAAAGMGQCYLQIGNKVAALQSFHRALKLNPGLESVRSQVAYLQRQLKNK